MRLDKEQYEIIVSLAKKYGLSQKEVLEIVESPFKMIRETTKNLNRPAEGMTKEEFDNHMVNFNIPKIGKLHGSFTAYERFYYGKKKKEG